MKKQILMILVTLFLFPILASAGIEGHFDRVGKLPAEKSLDQVRVVEIFSFTCPHCFNFNSAVKKLKKKFGNKIKLVSYPIGWSGLNPSKLYYIAKATSDKKAEETKDFIFTAVFDSGIREINNPQVINFIANQVGLKKEYEEKKDSVSILDAIRYGKTYAKDFKVTGTPTLIIEGSIKAGGNVDNLAKIINSLLKKPVDY
ncbi:MAG: thiol:disulfide interchange protein DsbA [bacterium]|jgi:thiol:disulfide interchange protein DsbA